MSLIANRNWETFALKSDSAYMGLLLVLIALASLGLSVVSIKVTMEYFNSIIPGSVSFMLSVAFSIGMMGGVTVAIKSDEWWKIAGALLVALLCYAVSAFTFNHYLVYNETKNFTDVTKSATFQAIQSSANNNQASMTVVQQQLTLLDNQKLEANKTLQDTLHRCGNDFRNTRTQCRQKAQKNYDESVKRIGDLQANYSQQLTSLIAQSQTVVGKIEGAQKDMQAQYEKKKAEAEGSSYFVFLSMLADFLALTLWSLSNWLARPILLNFLNIQQIEKGEGDSMALWGEQLRSSLYKKSHDEKQVALRDALLGGNAPANDKGKLNIKQLSHIVRMSQPAVRDVLNRTAHHRPNAITAVQVGNRTEFYYTKELPANTNSNLRAVS